MANRKNDKYCHNLKILILFRKIFPAIILSVFVFLCILGYNINESAYFYTLSATAQTIAAIIGFLSMLSIYRIKDMKFILEEKKNKYNEINRPRGPEQMGDFDELLKQLEIQIDSIKNLIGLYSDFLRIVAVEGLIIIFFSLLCIPFGKILLPENNTIFLLDINPLLIVGLVLVGCAHLFIDTLISIYAICEGELLDTV